MAYNRPTTSERPGGLSTVTRAAAVRVALLALICAAIAGTGCQTGKVTQSQEEGQASQKALDDLLKYAQETGQTLGDLQQTLARWRAAEEQDTRVSAVAQDIRVLKSLLGSARAAIDSKQEEAALGLLKRMNRAARGLLAELPGQRIALRVERALMELKGDEPDGAAASEAILSALDAALNAREAALVPDVVKDLEAAKRAVTSDAKAATEMLLVVLGKCGSDDAAAWAYYLVEGLDGAFQAVQRKAWPVAAAELEQVEELLGKLDRAVSGAQQEPEAGGTQAPGETPTTGSQPEGAPATAPAGRAPGQPAAGEAAATGAQPQGAGGQ